MKKTLLFACVAMAFTASAQSLNLRQAPAIEKAEASEESALEFCYCGSMGIAPDIVDAGVPVSGAMYIPAEEAARFKGSSITAVSVFAGYDSQTGLNEIREANVWITYDLSSEPFTSSNGPLADSPLQYNSIPLEKPYVIEGDKGFYVGYTVVSVNRQQCPMLFDWNTHENDWGGWYKLGENEWINQSENYGFVLIKARIEGNKLPTNAASIYSADTWGFAYPGERVETDMQIINMGAEPLKNVTVEVSCGDSAPVSGTLPIEGEILYNDLVRVYLDTYINQTGNNIPIKIRIAEINGKPNEYEGAETVNYVLSLPEGDGFTRNVVMEQGTSLEQGGSPLGIVANRLMGETFGTTDKFIPVMVHMYDDLTAEGYNEFFTSYLCTRVPSVIPNRMRQFRNTRAGYDEVEAVFEQVYSMPAFARMKAAVNQDETDPSTLNISTSTWFLNDCSGEWRLAYVLRRDNVGPASQMNFYSSECTRYPGTEPLGEMGGFEDEPDPCDILLDNIAILIEDYNGIAGSVPADVKGGTEYKYDYTIHLDDETKLKNTTVLVYLINALNGCIEQAVAIPFSEFNGASVSEIAEAGVEVSGLSGAIRIAGEFNYATVYDMAGVRMAEVNNSSTLRMASGIYIVNVDGNTHKVLVK